MKMIYKRIRIVRKKEIKERYILYYEYCDLFDLFYETSKTWKEICQ